MPPKAKFTKEQIVSAALDIIRERGVDELTARALGNKLESSACPIFTVFDTMEEVMSETVKAAYRLYDKYIAQGLQDTPAFKGVGMQYIAFAIEEPKLFQLLFMTEKEENPTIENVLPVIDTNYPIILSSVKAYGLSDANAEKLYKHLWVYSHGIAVLCATRLCSLTMEEIGNMLTEIFIALLKEVKTGEKI